MKTCPGAHDDSLGAGQTASDAVASADDPPSGRDEAGGDRREAVEALAAMLDVCNDTVWDRQATDANPPDALGT